MKSGKPAPSAGQSRPRRGRFGTFLVVSVLFHAAVTASFFRFVQSDKFARDSRGVFGVAADSSARAFDPKQWGLYTAQSPGTGTPRAEQSLDSLWRFNSTQPVSFPLVQETSLAEWLSSLSGQPQDFAALMQQYPDIPENDQLFAASEMLRSAIVEQMIQSMYGDSGALSSGTIDWDKVADLLTSMLKERFKNAGKDTGQNGFDKAARSLFEEELLEQLWQQAFLFSMRDVALKRLEEAMRLAVERCLEMGLGDCSLGSKSGFPDGLDENGKHRVRSRGNGGRFIGFDRKGKKRFESEFEKTLAILTKSGLGNYASLFPSKELNKRLADLARKSLAHALKGDAGAEQWAKEIDFERMIANAFRTRPSANARAMQQAQDLLDAINKTLGKNLVDKFGAWPTAQDLKQNPWYFHSLANRYWDLVYQLMRSPNLVMPNLEKYTKAALEMRNRTLPQAASLLVGNTAPVAVSSLDFFTPRTVYVASLFTNESQTQSAPLIKPDFATGSWGASVRRTSAVNIDGVLDEWDICRPYALWGERQGPLPLPDMLKGQNFLMTQWDNTGLYCAYRISDVRDTRGHLPEFWLADAFELFFDPQNAKDSVRIEGRTCQFWIWPRSGGQNGSTGQSVFVNPSFYQPKILADGLLRFASQRNGDDYSVEAFVPASLVPSWYPLPGKIIGFNYSINNGELVFVRWSTNKGRVESEHPNLWGDLLLMGADATLSLSPGEVIFPGQNLDITATDPDMDLDAGKRDLVWVVVRSRLSGDSFPLSLVETGNSTGVFSGPLGTVFGIKAKVQNRLSVRPGDVVSIDYLDQHATGGRKNIEVHKSIEVGRGVFVFK